MDLRVQSLRLVSVVMPSLNQAPFIGAAIDSVLGQDYANVELIVADVAHAAELMLKFVVRKRATTARREWPEFFAVTVGTRYRRRLEAICRERLN